MKPYTEKDYYRVDVRNQSDASATKSFVATNFSRGVSKLVQAAELADKDDHVVILRKVRRSEVDFVLGHCADEQFTDEGLIVREVSGMPEMPLAVQTDVSKTLALNFALSDNNC